MVEVTAGTEDEVPAINMVTIEVPNLWRLEAQRGVFLDCGVNWDFHYPMDRILFPYSGYPASPTRGDIYPARKSQLEILLEQYFMNEKLLRGKSELRAFLGTLKAASVGWHDLKAHPNNTNPKYFVNGSVPVLDSWAPALLQPWRDAHEETLEASSGPALRVAVDLGLSSSQLRKAMLNGIMRILEGQPGLRRRSVSWLMVEPHGTLLTLDQALLQAMDWIWDGMRLLPYTNLHIARALVNCYSLHQAGFGEQFDEEKAKKLVSDVFGGEAMLVEFGAPDGSYARGYALRSDLEKAFRPDIRHYLLSEHAEYLCESLDNLLHVIHAPDRTFDFSDLVEMFALQLIPTQVLVRAGMAAFFSPARLNSLGLP